MRINFGAYRRQADANGGRILLTSTCDTLLNFGAVRDGLDLFNSQRDISPHEGKPQAERSPRLHGERQNSGDAKTFPYIDDETGGNSKRVELVLKIRRISASVHIAAANRILACFLW